MKKWLAWVACIVIVMVVGTAAHAQLTFTPRVSVTEEYNDNIDLDRTNKMNDWITTVSPGATLEWLRAGGRACACLRPAYSFYADHDEYDSWSHRASGIGLVQLLARHALSICPITSSTPRTRCPTTSTRAVPRAPPR